MTPDECRKSVLLAFSELFPNCNVVPSYPNVARPPLPYIVLDFESIVTVGSFETIEDGILLQQKYKRIPFTAELATESKTSHSAGMKKTGLSTTVDDLDQAVQFFDSQYAADKMRSLNITVCAEGNPQAIHNSVSGVERARCSFSASFVQCTKEYAALAPTIGEYTEGHNSAAAKAIADAEAGWFEEVEVKREIKNE